MTSLSFKSFLSHDAYKQIASSGLGAIVLRLPSFIGIAFFHSAYLCSAAAPCLVLAGHLKELHKQLCVRSACAGASRTQASCTASMAERCATAGARYQLGHSTLWKQPWSGHGAGQPSTAECKDVSSDNRESPWAAGKPHAVGSDSPRSVCGQCNVFFVKFVNVFHFIFKGFAWWNKADVIWNYLFLLVIRYLLSKQVASWCDMWMWAACAVLCLHRKLTHGQKWFSCQLGLAGT